MRAITRTIMAALALLGAAGGCQKYVELHNTNERIWIMSQDATEVFRCIDLTPPGTVDRSEAHVVCKRAKMVGHD